MMKSDQKITEWVEATSFVDTHEHRTHPTGAVLRDGW
ncbi:hypothetical protein ACVWW4_000092 [Bradyrhizobium sp. LB7.1]